MKSNPLEIVYIHDSTNEIFPALSKLSKEMYCFLIKDYIFHSSSAKDKEYYISEFTYKFSGKGALKHNLKKGFSELIKSELLFKTGIDCYIINPLYYYEVTMSKLQNLHFDRYKDLLRNRDIGKSIEKEIKKFKK